MVFEDVWGVFLDVLGDAQEIMNLIWKLFAEFLSASRVSLGI